VPAAVGKQEAVLVAAGYNGELRRYSGLWNAPHSTAAGTASLPAVPFSAKGSGGGAKLGAFGRGGGSAGAGSGPAAPPSEQQIRERVAQQQQHEPRLQRLSGSSAGGQHSRPTFGVVSVPHAGTSELVLSASMDRNCILWGIGGAPPRIVLFFLK